MALTPTITKYMMRHFLVSFFGVLFILLALTFLFDFIELMRRTASRPNVTIQYVLEMTALKLPSMLHILLPFVVLISSLLVFWRLSKSHELIIIRAAGVSVWQFIAPMLIATFVIGVLNITAFNPLAAATYKNYERLEDRFGMSSANPLNISNQGLWLKETRDNTQYTIHAGKIKQTEKALQMEDMSIFETDANDRFLRRIEAAKGTLKDHKFYLENAWIMEVGKAALFKEKLEIETILSLNKIQDNFSSPETVSFWTLPDFIKFFEQTGFSPLKHQLHWYSLIASPLFLCAMVLIAAVFSLNTNQRQGGIFLQTALGISAGFILFFLSKVSYAFGSSASIPLFLAVWSPSLIAIPLCLFALLHREDG
ncbi:MAG: LPS export ABC transporter permease LptG [Alphaproteobacteria bacterium]|nr:LPS export ABC transporter permease LptG [Alphaproteobacteria bacterium]